MSFAAKLKKAQQMWKEQKAEAKEGKDQFQEFEDGRYTFKLVAAEVGESNSSGRVQIAWQWEFEEGDYAGQKKYDFDGLETEQSLYWLNVKLLKLEVEPPDDIVAIEDLLEELVKQGIRIRGKLVTKRDFQNLRVEKLLDPAPQETKKTSSKKSKPAPEPEPEEEEEEEEEEESEPEPPKKTKRKLPPI